MKKYISLPALFLLALLTKSIISGASIGDAIGLIALAGLYGYSIFVEKSAEVPVNKEILNRIADLEEANKVLRDKVNAVSLGNGLRKHG